MKFGEIFVGFDEQNINAEFLIEKKAFTHQAFPSFRQFVDKKNLLMLVSR